MERKNTFCGHCGWYITANRVFAHIHYGDDDIFDGMSVTSNKCKKELRRYVERDVMLFALAHYVNVFVDPDSDVVPINSFVGK